MVGEVRVGTSGWQYDDWRGAVYPEEVGQARWLSHYVTWFPTVEVNSTFYRLAKEPAVRRWAETAPPGFEFVLKGSQFITHRLKLKEAAGAVERFFAPLHPILSRTSVVLWQLPPGWKRDLDRLDAFLVGLPRGDGWPRYAVEFRDDDWFHPDTDALLDAHGAAPVWLSSSLTSRHRFPDVGDLAYVRFHGLSEQPYRHAYSEVELAPWVQRLRDVAASGRPAWAFFNNDFHGNAVRDARTLIRLLGDAARPWPTGSQDDRPDGLSSPSP